MKKIHIYMVCLQAWKLFFEYRIEILGTFKHPYRCLCCKINLVTIAVKECLSGYLLTVSAMIVKCSVNIVKSVVYCLTYYSYCLCFINISFIIRRKSHHAETDRRNLNACFSKLSVLHNYFPPWYKWCIYKYIIKPG